MEPEGRGTQGYADHGLPQTRQPFNFGELSGSRKPYPNETPTVAWGTHGELGTI